MKELVREVRTTTSVQQQLVAMLLKPWKFLFGNGKNKKRRRSYCTTKLIATKSTRVVKKTVELCHTYENKHLAKQLPLSREEAIGPSPTGLLPPIIN